MTKHQSIIIDGVKYYKERKVDKYHYMELVHGNLIIPGTSAQTIIIEKLKMIHGNINIYSEQTEPTK